MNIRGYFRLDSPATSARIRMACVDPLTKKVIFQEYNCYLFEYTHTYIF